ncbi:hypothetical protein NDU88_001871 [Pleurodeles waltl]|uniref:Uncharacterized protein n=1 Tax=Pleurodeles waltl TaxID=8319 RepID=A0AAV7KXB8_PLEWA|nr:hypothetical protein NDU88_001871 [Pleurodeles waltl]
MPQAMPRSPPKTAPVTFQATSAGEVGLSSTVDRHRDLEFGNKDPGLASREERRCDDAASYATLRTCGTMNPPKASIFDGLASLF